MANDKKDPWLKISNTNFNLEGIAFRMANKDENGKLYDKATFIEEHKSKQVLDANKQPVKDKKGNVVMSPAFAGDLNDAWDRVLSEIKARGFEKKPATV